MQKYHCIFLFNCIYVIYMYMCSDFSSGMFCVCLSEEVGPLHHMIA